MAKSISEGRRFTRKRGPLPGQSGDDELGLDYRIRVGDQPSSTIINREFIQVGNVGRGDYVEIDHDSLSLYGGGDLCVDIQTDGDVFLGSDVSIPGSTHFSIFANNQTYNSESVKAGDMLIGDNSTGKANIYWDKSEGRLKFRGGTSVELYIDTDGSLAAGDGSVTLDSDGISIDPGNTGPQIMKVVDGGANIAEFYGVTDPGAYSQLSLRGRGRGGSSPITHEGIVEIVAITDDGSAHDGTASVTATLDTSDGSLAVSADVFSASKGAVFNESGADADFRIESDAYSHIFFVDANANAIGVNNSAPDSDSIVDMGTAGKPVIVPVMTGTQIGNVTPAEGMLAYNSTDGTLDYYDGSSWLQLTGS